MLKASASSIQDHKLTTSSGEQYEFSEIATPSPPLIQEAKFSDSERNALHGLLNVHQDFVYSFDEDLRLTFVNQALLSLWGLTKEDAVGKNFAELGYPQSLVELHEAQLKLAFLGKTIRGENEYNNPDGKYGYYEYIFAPIRKQDGSVNSVVGVTRDITHRKLLEEERERLLYAIAHDMRSPLGVIAAGSDLLELDNSKDVLQLIKGNARRAIRLLEDLLDSARIRAGESVLLRQQSIDLRTLCMETIEEFKILHGDRFAIDVPDTESPCLAHVDPHAIQRVLANLVSNAVKYGVQGAPITIALRKGDEQRYELSVRNVCDKPIPEKQLKEFFELFRRGAIEGKAHASRGWGIGLPTSARLVKEHGGELEARSDENAGTTFTAIIPAKTERSP
ncbi:PAS domain-containing sensor histidine kinase [Pelagicoccus sp. SDUM812003]|uniref:PAS domain-containing sensor histidine kinase n=1 Tax=Pelagicoccus sp. SDUM812003 TaxID=3041267 RepID=UPI00280E8438|nr:PAS domain-containing sensor histidine kinase [Pelagicoccus sp. SDUM812003]MDQ8201820.1 PAS domain-containing sensor histidine kinase [Pelagicoccus sp. SDUM812003]